jgi:hypothetical protein
MAEKSGILSRGSGISGTRRHIEVHKLMRRALVIALSSMLVLTLVSPVAGATIKRTWWASLGTSGANGRITLNGYLTGDGGLQISLKALRANTTYSIRVRAGGCSTTGSLLHDGGYLKTDGSGAASANRYVWLGAMNRIWGKIRFYTVSVRVTAGTSQRCAHFYYNKATRVKLNAYGIDLAVIASGCS